MHVLLSYLAPGGTAAALQSVVPMSVRAGRSALELMSGSDILLSQGVRYERGGALQKALDAYVTAEQRASSPSQRTVAIRRQAEVLRKLGRYEESLARARESRGLALGLGDGGRRLAEALNAEALVHLALGEFDRAEPLLHHLLSATGSQEHRGIALQNLSYIAAHQQRWADAEALLDQAWRAFRAAGFRRGEILALNNLGALRLDQGDPAAALERFADASHAALLDGDQELHAISAINQAEALARLGRANEAMLLITAAMGYFQQVKDDLRLIECYLAVGDIERASGNEAGAQLAYGNARAIAHASGIRTYDAKLAERLASVRPQVRAAPADDTVPQGILCDAD